MNLKRKSAAELRRLYTEKTDELQQSKMLVDLLYFLYSKSAVKPYPMFALDDMVLTMRQTYKSCEDDFDPPF